MRMAPAASDRDLFPDGPFRHDHTRLGTVSSVASRRGLRGFRAIIQPTMLLSPRGWTGNVNDPTGVDSPLPCCHFGCQLPGDNESFPSATPEDSAASGRGRAPRQRCRSPPAGAAQRIVRALLCSTPAPSAERTANSSLPHRLCDHAVDAGAGGGRRPGRGARGRDAGPGPHGRGGPTVPGAIRPRGGDVWGVEDCPSQRGRGRISPGYEAELDRLAVDPRGASWPRRRLRARELPCSATSWSSRSCSGMRGRVHRSRAGPQGAAGVVLQRDGLARRGGPG